jgi:hypothetical protein
VVRLGFLSCQFNIGKYDDGYIRGFVVGLDLFFFLPSLVLVTRLTMDGRISVLLLSHVSVLDNQMDCHRLYYAVILLPIVYAHNYLEDCCCNCSSLCQFLCYSVWCAIVAFLGRTEKTKYVQINHMV